MAASIVQKGVKECFLCRRDAEQVAYYGPLQAAGLHKHHIIFGNPGRKLSEKYGLWCWLCLRHHTGSSEAVHKNRENDLYLKRLAQEAFESNHSRDEWMQIFERNYLSNYLSSEPKSQEDAKESQEVGFWLIE